jgi:hypothetical protein
LVRCWFYEFCTRACSCLTELFNVILATPPEKKIQANLKLNRSSPIMSSKIHTRYIVMVTLEEVPEDACKAFLGHL